MRPQLLRAGLLSRALSAALVALAAAMVGWAATRGQEGQAAPRSQESTYLAFHLPVGRPLDLVVPSGIGRIRLMSFLEVAPEEVVDADLVLPYRLDLSWLSGEGEPLYEWSAFERSWVSWLPGPQETPLTGGHLLEGGRWLTDGRLTVIPGGELLPGGGVLRVQAAATTRPLLLMAFGEKTLSGFSARKKMLASSIRPDRRKARDLGLPTFNLLSLDERTLLQAREWERLDARGRADLEHRSSRIVLSDFRLGWSERPFNRITVGPGRSLALNFEGVGAVQLSGAPEIASLERWLVADGPEGAAAPALKVGPGAPLGFSGESTTLRLTVPGDAPTSLHLHNPTDRPIGPLFVSTDTPRADALFGWTTGEWLSRLAKSPPGASRDPVLLTPERRVLRAWRVQGEGAPPLRFDVPTFHGDEVLSVTARAELAGPDDRSPRVLLARGLGEGGQVIWRRELAITPVPSRYELPLPAGAPLPEEASWLSEPHTFYVVGDDRVTTLELRSPDRLLASVRGMGPENGDDTLYPLPYGQVRVRYRWRALSPWHVLPPEGEDRLRAQGRLALFSANVRLEPLGAGASAGGAAEAPVARRFAPLKPARPAVHATRQLWLTRPDSPSRQGLIYCRYPAGQEGGFPFSRAAADRLGGRLSGVVWAPGVGQLGQPWRVLLDGQPWRQDVFRQRVTVLNGVRRPAHHTARLEAPRGATLWLRTTGQGQVCRDAHRPTWVYPLAPGQRLDFTLRKTLREQRVILAGVAPPGLEEAPLVVDLDGGQARRAPGIYGGLTAATRPVTLVPQPGGEALTLSDPGRAGRPLVSGALLLGEDLPLGAHTLSVLSRAATTLYLRAGIETTRPAEIEVPTTFTWSFASSEDP